MRTRLMCVVPVLVLCQFFLSHAVYADNAGHPLTEKKAFEILNYESLPPMALEAQKYGSDTTDRNATTWKWSVEAFGKMFHFILEPNSRLIAKLPTAQKEKALSGSELYRGRLEGVTDSWIRLTKLGQQWSGMIWDGEEIYIIDSMPVIASALAVVPPSENSGHGMYRLSDTRDLGSTTCGLGMPGAQNSPITDYKALLQELRSFVPAEAEGARFNIDMAVVADPQFAQIQQNSFGTGTEAAVIARMNIVDGIYSEQVGVQINLVQIRALAQNGTLTSTSASTLLNQFGNFTNSSSFDHPGVAHLFTGRDLNGSTVGIAFLSSLCNARFGIGVDQIRGGGTAGALVVAHELGHNFGAPHDNQGGSACASTGGNFIMNPSLNNQDQFSPCSLQQMQPVVNGASCITVIDLTRPVVTITSPADGASVEAGTSISFAGRATDVEDGNLTTALIWTSDRDGRIGAGGSFARTLTTGTHRITASATDSDGGTTTQVISVVVRAVTPPPPPPPPPTGDVLFESKFNQGPDGFAYSDDTFRNTNQPNFASGTHVPAQGALRVLLGGVNNATIRNMSGGWSRAFTLQTASQVTVTVRYKLTQASDYERDEISQALLSVDNRLFGVSSNDFLARIVGNGNGGSAQTTGFVVVNVSLGSLSAGRHTLTIGGFNNKKTFANESTEVLIDNVVVRKGTSSPPPPPPPPPPGGAIIESSFDGGSDGFTFVDDTFRKTNQPNFSNGSHQPNQGFKGGGLQVRLGGVNNANILNMSGGWRRTFTLTSSRQLTISFRYRLTQASNYERDEFSEALVAVDRKLLGNGGSEILAKVTGDGNGGPFRTTGWKTATVKTETLSPGSHTMTIGAFNNKKTFRDEVTWFRIDDVIVR